MLIYNVTVKIDQDVHQDWLQWMRETHIPKVMQTGKFDDYRICRMMHEEPDGVTYAVQYFCPDLTAMYAYQQEHAKALQAEVSEYFPGKFVVFRTLMEVL